MSLQDIIFSWTMVCFIQESYISVKAWFIDYMFSFFAMFSLKTLPSQLKSPPLALRFVPLLFEPRACKITLPRVVCSGQIVGPNGLFGLGNFSGTSLWFYGQLAAAASSIKWCTRRLTSLLTDTRRGKRYFCTSASLMAEPWKATCTENPLWPHHLFPLGSQSVDTRDYKTSI